MREGDKSSMAVRAAVDREACHKIWNFVPSGELSTDHPITRASRGAIVGHIRCKSARFPDAEAFGGWGIRPASSISDLTAEPEFSR